MRWLIKNMHYESFYRYEYLNRFRCKSCLNWSYGHPIDRCCHILNIPHSSDDKRRAILQWGTKMVVSICKPPPCTHFQQYNCKLIPITARRSHPAQYGEDRFGPPTLERSGSEHRVGRFTSFLLRFLSPTRGTEGVVKTIEKAWLEVELPLERETEGFEKILL